MRRQHIFVAATSVILLIAAAPAQAQWFAKVTGPDVFGATSVAAGVPGDQDTALVVQCDSTDMLDLAYIESATPSEVDRVSQLSGGIPAHLLIRIGSGSVHTMDAKVKQWNDTHIGVVAEGRTPEMLSILQAMGNASGEIAVGAEVLGNKEGENFTAEGSTDAMRKVISDCKLGDVGNSQKDAKPGS